MKVKAEKNRFLLFVFKLSLFTGTWLKFKENRNMQTLNVNS